MLSLNQLIQRNTDLIHANIDNETMLMSLSNGEYYGMNDIGSKIWELLENSMSVAELISELTNIYELTAKQCEQDIQPFLTSLHDKDIIELKN